MRASFTSPMSSMLIAAAEPASRLAASSTPRASLLIFYAFDLDHRPGVKNASAFQVWGQKDTESGEKNRATNLGILYMDSESNRRWVLRLEDPKQLAEIDAVFVTVEPHGGSQKPTGKPFLYALLRREANHP